MRILKSLSSPSLSRPATKELLALLSNWRGRSFVQGELESRGFAVPLRYQQIVAQNCILSSAEGLDLYWNELAREYVCSAGRAKSDIRLIPENTYRSKYLDQLADAQPPSQDSAIGLLHPCVNEFETKMKANNAIAPQIIRELEIAKNPEIVRHGISAAQWSGHINDVASVFTKLLEDRGFEVNAEGYIRRTAGLVFGGFLDLGRGPHCIGVPFRPFISLAEDSTEIFRVSPENIVKGYWNYYRFSTIEAGVLGFRAYVEFVDVLSASFS
jgi:hypothetical protein